jgi:hypothetical protein
MSHTQPRIDHHLHLVMEDICEFSSPTRSATAKRPRDERDEEIPPIDNKKRHRG